MVRTKIRRKIKRHKKHEEESSRSESGSSSHSESRRSDETVCRYCLEPTDEMIRPCSCNTPVHRECLNTWKDANSVQECEICRGEYTTTVERLFCTKGSITQFFYQKTVFWTIVLIVFPFLLIGWDFESISKVEEPVEAIVTFVTSGLFSLSAYALIGYFSSLHEPVYYKRAYLRLAQLVVFCVVADTIGVLFVIYVLGISIKGISPLTSTFGMLITMPAFCFLWVSWKWFDSACFFEERWYVDRNIN